MGQLNHQDYLDLGWYELLIWLVYVLAGATVVYFVKNVNDFNKNMKYLMHGYFLKVFGGLLIALVYFYYYGGTGDTIDYYFGTKQMIGILYQKTDLFFKLIFVDSERAQELLQQNGIYIMFSRSNEEWFMLRISTVFNFFGFDTYLGMTYFFSVISLIGSQYISKYMNQITPNSEKQIFYINYLLPSVLMWGSGALKDTWTFFCFGIVCWMFYRVTYQKKYFSSIIFMLLPMYIIFQLKAYIIVAFFVWIILTLFYLIKNKSENPIVNFLLIPFLLILFIIVGIVASQQLAKSNQEFQTDQMMSKIQGFHEWHTQLGGSIYNLGEVEYTPIGLLKKMPQAINVSLFRPYIWEVKSVFSLITSIESMTLMFLFLRILIKSKMKFFGILKKNSFLIGGFVFVLFFAFAIGISSYNFGALTRFKIPLLPISFFLIYYASYKLNENSDLNKLDLNEIDFK